MKKAQITQTTPAVIVDESITTPSKPQDLDTLKKDILNHKEQIEQSFIEMGRSLIEVKNILAHGEFLPWVRANIDIKPRTAQCYMALAEEFANASPVSLLGFSKAKIILALPSSSRDTFLEEPHEVNGGIKTVAEMSKRELEAVVREHKKGAKIARIKKVPDSIADKYEQIEYLREHTNNLLEYRAKYKENPDLYNDLTVELRNLCNHILELISSE